MDERIKDSAVKIFLLIIEHPEIIGSSHMEMLGQIAAREHAADFAVILAEGLDKAFKKIQ